MRSEEKIKKAFLEISISPEIEKRILDKTIENQTKNQKYTKWVYLLGIVLLIFAVSLPIVYAKEIQNIIKKWSSHVELEDGTKVEVSVENGFKRIPLGAVKTKKYGGMKEFRYDELEKMLGFKTLKRKEENPPIYYSTGLNQDETIGRIDLWIAPFVGDSEKKNICLLVSMLNVGADPGYVSAFQGDRDATAEKNGGESYHIDHLNVDVVLYGSDWDAKRLTATFVYKDIQYQFIGQDFSKEEMIDVLESLTE